MAVLLLVHIVLLAGLDLVLRRSEEGNLRWKLVRDRSDPVVAKILATINQVLIHCSTIEVVLALISIVPHQNCRCVWSQQQLFIAMDREYL